MKLKNNKFIMSLIIVASVIFLIGIGYIFYSNVQQIGFSQLTSTTSSLLNEDDTSATYNYGYSANPILATNAEINPNFDLDVPMVQDESTRPPFVEGLQQNVWFETQDYEVDFKGLVGYGSNNPTEISVIIENKNALCRISKDEVSNTANIHCRFIGTLRPINAPEGAEIRYFGGGTGTINSITFLKEGVETACVTNADCGVETVKDICFPGEGNVHVETTTPECTTLYECSDSIHTILKESCSAGCENGACIIIDDITTDDTTDDTTTDDTIVDDTVTSTCWKAKAPTTQQVLDEDSSCESFTYEGLCSDDVRFYTTEAGCLESDEETDINFVMIFFVSVGIVIIIITSIILFRRFKK